MKGTHRKQKEVGAFILDFLLTYYTESPGQTDWSRIICDQHILGRWKLLPIQDCRIITPRIAPNMILEDMLFYSKSNVNRKSEGFWYGSLYGAFVSQQLIVRTAFK